MLKQWDVCLVEGKKCQEVDRRNTKLEIDEATTRNPMLSPFSQRDLKPSSIKMIMIVLAYRS